MYLTVSFSGRFTEGNALHPCGLGLGGDVEFLDISSEFECLAIASCLCAASEPVFSDY